MNDYYYYKKKNGELYRFRVEQDDEPWDPRYDCDGNVGHMMCWYKHYNLGDYKENKWADPHAFLDDLIRENITDKKIINFIKRGKHNVWMKLQYDRSERTYKLLKEKTFYDYDGTKRNDIVIAVEGKQLEYMVDDFIEELTLGDKRKLLENNGFYFLPLAVYEHSGITMWCGSKWSHFDAQWDCSDVGWIYTTKKEIIECGGQLKGKRKWRKVTERNWKEAAQIWLEGEVETYDMWLTGQVYGYILEKWDGYDWVDEDSCWGFYSKKWGDELALEIAHEGFTNEPFISEEEMEILCEAYTKQLEEDELIDSVAMVFA